MGLFDKIKNSMNNLFAGFRKVDEDFLDELTDTLILADVGFETSESIIDELRTAAKREKIENADTLKKKLKDIISEKMTGGNELNIGTTPSVIVVVGVNGVGKTTTIGKLANLLKKQGKSVLIAAADTFRAAAIEQLEIWADRAGIPIVKHQDGSDPAAVVFDALQAAKARKTDIVLCDTAGRLHNKKDLMAELSKITRVVSRELPDADTEILLVLDATTGQNAIAQAKDFKEATNITGVILTKLDGSAKGGVTIAVKDVTGVPIKLVGIGEKIDDLQIFDPDEFAASLID